MFRTSELRRRALPGWDLDHREGVACQVPVPSNSEEGCRGAGLQSLRRRRCPLGIGTSERYSWDYCWDCWEKSQTQDEVPSGDNTKWKGKQTVRSMSLFCPPSLCLLLLCLDLLQGSSWKKTTAIFRVPAKYPTVGHRQVGVELNDNNLMTSTLFPVKTT